jgi:hypothetical protein
MRFRIVIIFLLSLNNSFGQYQCSCDTNQNMNDAISCKPIVFKNKAKLFWQFNCDSSWLTFKSARGRKEIIFNMSMIELTGRLGYDYAAEFKTKFLITNYVISGCCDPPEFILFDKEKGSIHSELGPLIFYSENYNYPIVIYLNHRNDNLIVFNVDKNLHYKIPLPKGRISKTMKLTDEMFPEHFFETEVKNNVLIIKYQYKITRTKKAWLNAKITVDLKKYI